MRHYTCKLLIICLLSSNFILAQEYFDRDSLWRVMKTAKSDSNKVRLYIQLGQQYETNDPDSALMLYEKALKLSTELEYTRGIISYYTNATYVYNLKGKFDTALVLNLQSVEIARRFGDPERLAACLGNVGSSYMLLEQHEKAIEYYLEILPLFEKLPTNRNRAVIYDNLCVLYNSISQPAKAITYGQRALDMHRKNNNGYGLVTSLSNLGMAHNHLGNYNKSITFLEEGLVISKRINNQVGVMSAYLNLSDTYIDLGKFQAVKHYCEEALELATKLDDALSQAIALRGLAIYHFNYNNAKEAESYARKSLRISLDNGYLKHAGQAYNVLASVSILNRDFRSNITYSIKSDSIREVLFNDQIAKNVQTLEVKYETQGKEQQIKELQQEAEIKDLSIQQNKLVNGVLIGATISLLAITLLARRNYQQKRTLLKKENQVQEARIAQLESEKQILASEAVIKGQEQERGRLAKDLHDGLGGMLSGVKFSLSNMKSSVTLDTDNLLVFERSLDMLDHSIAELRRVAHNMMPEVLVKFGLSEALNSYCDSLRASQIFKIDYQKVGTLERLPEQTEIFLFRIVQELLNNVAKHAKASHVLVQLARHDREVSMTIEDNGTGFNTPDEKSFSGAGLASVRSRVEYLRGKIDIQSAPGQGTSIHITVPIS